MSYVRTETSRDITIVTIDRPARRNALDADTAAEVARSVTEAGRNSRIVIVTGAGGSFCAGGDLDELAGWSRGDPGDIGATLYGSFQAMILAVRSTDAVVIASVPGAAVGAGMDLALACDLRVAARSATFGQIWVRLGVIPGTGGAFLTQALAGPSKAAELLLTGEVIGADEALEAGLVNQVVDDDDLEAATQAWADRILRHPADGVRANKRAFALAQQAALDAALEHARAVQPERFTSDEFRAALERARSR